MFSLNDLRRLFALCLLSVPLAFVLPTHAADDPDKIPEPEDVEFETKDSLTVHATFYPGVLKKKSIPFLMVHGWEGNRGQFDKLAKELQKRGNAVLAIDLRGHGESLNFKGSDRKLDPSKFTLRDIDAMMLDIEAGKKFLMERNSQGELNIEALCVVAAQEGCIPAIKWTVLDWNAPQLPAYKQGQDVKALILFSPILSYKGANAQPALTDASLQKNVAFYVAVGKKDPKAMTDAKRIQTAITPFRPKDKDSGFDFQTFDTNLGGPRLVTTPGLDTLKTVLLFVKGYLVDKLDTFEWSERKRPT